MTELVGIKQTFGTQKFDDKFALVGKDSLCQSILRRLLNSRYRSYSTTGSYRFWLEGFDVVNLWKTSFSEEGTHFDFVDVKGSNAARICVYLHEKGRLLTQLTHVLVNSLGST